MYKYILYSLLFLVSCTPKFAPSSAEPVEEIIEDDEVIVSKDLLFSIPVKAKYFATDKLNQFYTVTDKNEIIKFDSKGKEVFRYTNNYLDNLTHLDATDPFNILLYYPDFLSVITLDRTMNETGNFDLSNLNFIQVKAIGTSNDNNIWLFDEVAFKLKKINRNGTVLRQSVDLNLQMNHKPKPVFLIERENAVFVNDPEYGIIVFNIFGEYDSVLNLKGLDQFQVLDNQLLFKKDKKMFSYHIQSLRQKEIKLPVELNASDEVLIQKNRVCIRKANRIEVYQLQ